jgi:large subunit ribosomal protein L6
MSRVGKHPVSVPSGVTVSVADRTVKAKGRLGELSVTLSEAVELNFEYNTLTVTPLPGGRGRAQWGTARANLANLVKGVSEGFKRELEINGVGYRAQLKGATLVLSLGYSHDIEYPIPAGIEMKCDKPTSVVISGADKQLVGQVASEIRAMRPPEPYKGKGVKYIEETITRKEGKKK